MDKCPQCGYEHGSKSRSSAQNRLAHKWFAVIAKATHTTPDDVKGECKLRFGVPILSVSDESFGERWFRLCNAVHYEWEAMKDMAYMCPMTSLMSVEEMTEFLNNVDHKYQGEGIYLPTRDTLYYEAMGLVA